VGTHCGIDDSGVPGNEDEHEQALEDADPWMAVWPLLILSPSTILNRPIWPARRYSAGDDAHNLGSVASKWGLYGL